MAVDIDALYRLDLACFEEPFRFDRRMISRLVRSSLCVTLLAHVDGRMAGFLSAEVDRCGGAVYVATLDVEPQMRRAGVASGLLQALEREVRLSGIERVWLHASVQNAPALAFYAARGYVVLDEAANYYGAGLSALLLGKTFGVENSPE